jgi:predicted MFS family arabinose efflux permease
LAFVSQPWATIALFTALSALSTFVRPATSAMVPAIVGPDDAPRGYARLTTGSGLGWIIGPALGGVLTAAIGVGPTLLLDAGTFVGLSIAVAFIRARRPPHSAERSVHGSESDVRGSGLALLMRSPVLRVAIVTTAVSLGCAVVDNVAAPFRFINQLHTAESDYGLYLALWGIGSLLAVQLVAKLRSDQHPATLAVGNALVGLGIAGIGLAPNLTVALIASAAGGFGNGLVNVVESALVAAHTPQAQHGRAFAASGAVMQSAIGVGTAAAAPLVAGFGAGHAMTLAGTLAAIAAVAGLAVVRTRGGNPKAMP